MISTKILVVDDEFDLKHLIKQRFKKQILNQTYEFIFAGNGKEALEKLQAEKDKIALVLTDINMPKMDGLTLLGKLPEIDPTIKAVVISAYGDLKNIRVAMNQGAFDFITKPIDFYDLEVTINKTLEFVQLQREQRHQLQQAQLQLEFSMQQIIKAKETAESANRAKSIFLAKMSHELRTPLNAILGFTQLMNQNRSLDREGREQLKIIKSSGQNLLSLINDILEMSKLESGRVTFQENSFDVFSLLDELQEIFEPLATAKGLVFNIEPFPPLEPYIKTDEQKLRRVLINLLDNGIKFTETGSVTLKVEILRQTETGKNEGFSPPQLCFEVEDTGPGIPSDTIDVLFEAFVQNEASQNTLPGTGLGLYVSRQFVQLMGGELKVKSVVGHGTTFRIELPFHPGEVADIPPSSLKRRVIGLEAHQRVYRILVVEDQRESRKLLVQLLASLGFEVQEAANGQEAVRCWESWQPHLIWMDLQMPIMNGYEATQQIRSQLQGEAAIIIALTTYASEEDQGMALSIGCDDVVNKPFQPSTILEKMAKYLGVRYLYEEDSQKATVAASMNESYPPGELTPEQLANLSATMPLEWLTQLYQVSVGLDDESIFALLQEIPLSHPQLGNNLRNLVNNFQYDIIAALAEQAIKLKA